MCCSRRRPTRNRGSRREVTWTRPSARSDSHRISGRRARRRFSMSEERIDTVRLQNLAYGYRQSATLVAAIELDLFTKFSEGARTVEQIAASCDITPINAERLLVACAALGLVLNNGGEFSNAPDVERFLVKGAKNYAGPWLTTMGRSDYAEW